MLAQTGLLHETNKGSNLLSNVTSSALGQQNRQAKTIYFELVSAKNLGNLRIYSFFFFFYSCFMEAHRIKNSIFLSPVNLVFFLSLITKNEIEYPLI